MTDPDLWTLAAIALYAPHLSKLNGFLFSVGFISIAIYLRYFA